MANQPFGKLYIVATPIGNWDDITIRAFNTIKNAEILVCEEFRIGSTFLKKFGISNKEMITLNEHNEKEQTGVIVQKLMQGSNVALISDCGTPVFADPGHWLINQATQFGIDVVPVPGASSLMSILSVLDFKLEKFYFAGFLSREKEERKKELNGLRPLNIPIILMDTPYRLMKLLDEVASTFGKNRKVTLGLNITMANEKFLRGNVSEIQKQLSEKKAEFVLVIHPK